MVLSWGRDLDGYFGYQDKVIKRVKAELDADPTDASIMIAAGGAHTAVLQRGQLLTWGIGHDGRLGHGNEDYTYQPKPVDALEGLRCVAISAGHSHTAAVTSEGRLYTWGRGDAGQLGHAAASRELLPRQVSALCSHQIVAVVAGGLHTAAVTAAGRLYTWGDNSQGQLGHDNGYLKVLEPKAVEALADQKVVVLAAARYHTAVITERGQLLRWGVDKHGMGLAGTGFESEQVPQVIAELNPEHVYTVAPGHMHPPAAHEDGGIVVNLRDNPNQVDADTFENRLEPSTIETLVRRCLVT